VVQDHLAIFEKACLVSSDLLSQRRYLPVGVRVCGQRTSVRAGVRAAVGAAAPPANAGRGSKQLVTADPAEKMAARRPGDAAGGLKAAAVATSSPTTSTEHERIACRPKAAQVSHASCLEDLGEEGENVEKRSSKPKGVLQFAQSNP